MSYQGRPLGLGFFGSGRDGDQTVKDGVTSLTSDKYYNNLTIEASGTLQTNNYRVVVRNRLQNDGLMEITSNVDGGADGTKGTNTQGVYNATVDGGAGGTGAGSNASNLGLAIGGAGGNAGSGSSGAGGTGGTATVPTAAQGGIEVLNNSTHISLATTFSYGAGKLRGGAGGGGGGGDGTNSGGGGGAGGSYFPIVAYKISGSGTFSARGGNGGSPAAGNCGGGGGGGGGVIVFVTSSNVSSLTTTVAGGTGGTKSGTGNNGSNGSNGSVIVINTQ